MSLNKCYIAIISAMIVTSSAMAGLFLVAPTQDVIHVTTIHTADKQPIRLFMQVSVGVLKGDTCVYEKKMDPYPAVTYSDGEGLHYGGREFKLFVGVGYECAKVAFAKDKKTFSNAVTFQLFSDNQWNYVTTFPATDFVQF